MTNEEFQKIMLEQMAQLTQELVEVKQTVIRIENNHGEKLSALFDGYKQHTDQLNRIEEKVSAHDELF